jgi:ATP-dependent DNA helicase RecG
MSPQTDNGTQDVGLDVGLERKVVDEIRARPKIRMSEIAVKYQVTKRTVERVFSKLTQEGKIARVGGKRFGHWEVIDEIGSW